ncbi:MAG: IgGFc-binding protein [Bradymonadaceae bacterium]|nr:IgGFc-binding protein [Lujinxingiaceae bacterium]
MPDVGQDVPKVDVEADVEVDVPPVLPQICVPNALLGCRGENTPNIEVCNDAGTAILPGVCAESEVCRDGECIRVTCVPGHRKCGGNTPQMCNEDAETYRDLEPCPTDEEGRCDEGFCLNRCQIAEVENSYIGCEYWAVEMENHLLNNPDKPGDPPPLSPASHPPYAIVIANTSTSYEAEITIYSADGEFALSVPSRRVGTDIKFPGDELQTVYSEVLDINGVRTAGPLNGAVENLVLPRQSTMTLILPHRKIPFGATSLTDTGYRVVSTQPVIAYQFNPLCCNYNYTNDASLLLPTSALTENYMFMSHAVWAGGATRLPQAYSANLTVIATQPDTQVDIQLRPSKDPLRPYHQLVYPITSPDRISGPSASGLITVTMQPFEVLNVGGRGAAPVEDLTGARVTASKPVAVFGGHTCTNVPFSKGACDHLESQLFPMETWGRNFVAAPLKLRNESPTQHSSEGTYWKFLARVDNTVIKTGINLNRPNTLSTSGEGVKHCSDAQFSEDPATGEFRLNAGQTCEFGTRRMFSVIASEPILLGAFVSSQNTVNNVIDWGDYAGDPSFFLIPPKEQYRTSYSFLTPATYHRNFITVSIPPTGILTLDGQQIFPKDYDHEISPDQTMMRAHIPVGDGPHTISAPLAFGLVAYGYDNYVSYAYTGGLDLVKLSSIPKDNE